MIPTTHRHDHEHHLLAQLLVAHQQRCDGLQLQRETFESLQVADADHGGARSHHALELGALLLVGGGADGGLDYLRLDAHEGGGGENVPTVVLEEGLSVFGDLELHSQHASHGVGEVPGSEWAIK